MNGVPQISVQDLPADAALFGELLAGNRDHYHLEKRFIRKDGGILWGSVHVYKVLQDGRPMVVVVASGDPSVRLIGSASR